MLRFNLSEIVSHTKGIHPRNLILTLSLTFAKKTTRSLLIAIDSQHEEEQELAGSPDNGDM